MWKRKWVTFCTTIIQYNPGNFVQKQQAIKRIQRDIIWEEKKKSDHLCWQMA